MSKIRQSARNESCQIRLPGVCTHNNAETVLAHVRLAGITGVSQKAPDILGAWACSECHRVTEKEKADHLIQRYFYEGVIRTQYELIKRGVLKYG